MNHTSTKNLNNQIYFLLFPGRGLLEIMQGLQTYPPQDEPLTDDIREQFAHAIKFMSKQNDRNKKCGTLSKDEWEATCKPN